MNIHAGTTNNIRDQLIFIQVEVLIIILLQFKWFCYFTITTQQKFRDSSAWYHIVARCDTTMEQQIFI